VVFQALDRTQPGLPRKRGRAGTMTHDYKRHGTTTLFAALDVASGHLVRECLPRHRHQEFLRFMRRLDRSVAPALALHVILDNYATALLLDGLGSSDSDHGQQSETDFGDTTLARVVPERSRGLEQVVRPARSHAEALA
jgi:hypothetical protein